MNIYTVDVYADQQHLEEIKKRLEGQPNESRAAVHVSAHNPYQAARAVADVLKGINCRVSVHERELSDKAEILPIPGMGLMRGTGVVAQVTADGLTFSD